MFKYVRCDIETDPTVLETILFEIWKIDPPALLMQVTGGHKYFKLRGKMEVSLLDDLVEFVSKSSKASRREGPFDVLPRQILGC